MRPPVRGTATPDDGRRPDELGGGRMLPLIAFRLARRLALLVVLAVLAVVGATAIGVNVVARHDERAPSDALVVLGAAQFDGRPSPVLEARLAHAKRLFDDGVAPRIVTLGGGRPGDRFTEAAAGRRWLADHGVPADKVLALGEGRDTLSSLQALDRTFERRGWRSAVVVTDPLHSLRSRRMSRDLGISAETSPTRSGPGGRGVGARVRYTARETAAYLYYRLVQ